MFCSVLFLPVLLQYRTPTNRCLLSSDATGARTLGSSTYTSYTAMTEGACATYCGTKGFKYAGVEYGQECCE